MLTSPTTLRLTTIAVALAVSAFAACGSQSAAPVKVAPEAPIASASASALAPSAAAPPAPEPKESEPAPPPVDEPTFLVPIAGSPVLGKSTALVTIVEFGDFQCPFCGRVAPTLEAVRQRYGDAVRLVWKHEPLPMHPRAEPAAELALEARAQKGDDGFFRVADALFRAQPNLGDDVLLEIAKQEGLDVARVESALAKKTHAQALSSDMDLAEDVAADGTPHFFINGRRVVGAVPLADFAAVIDQELVRAKALLARGIEPSGVYDELQKSAHVANQPVQLAIPAAGPDQPVLGPKDAKVTIVEFSDFQCPFCSRGDTTIDALLALYPGKIKLVWRHLPLPFHVNAHIAAEAAIEAFRQKGSPAFWAYRSTLFKNQAGGLDRDSLIRYAKDQKLNVARFTTALDDHRHAKAVDADAQIAADAGINGTPAFVINGVLLSGAQPLGKFRRAVDRALAK